MQLLAESCRLRKVPNNGSKILRVWLTFGRLEDSPKSQPNRLVSLVCPLFCAILAIPCGNPTTLVGCQGHSAESWAVVSVCHSPVNATKILNLNKKTPCKTKQENHLLHFSPATITQSKDATSMINKLWFGGTVGHVQTISAMALPVSWPVRSSVDDKFAPCYS